MGVKRIRDVDDVKQRLVDVWSDFWHHRIPQPDDLVSSHRHRVRASDTPAPEYNPKFCSQLGLVLGC